jgi:hypothetical protein
MLLIFCAVPRELVTFKQDDRFAGPSTQENDAAWHDIMPVSAFSL